MAKAEYDIALQYYSDALKTDSAVDYLEGIAASHASMGKAYLAAGKATAANSEYESSLEYARFSGLGGAQSVAEAGLGEVAFVQGAKADALVAFEAAISLAGKDEKALSVALHDSAVVKAALGRLPEAISDLEKAQGMNLRAKRWIELGANRYALASALSRSGRNAEALATAIGALDADKRAENARAVSVDLATIATLSHGLGKEDQAWAYWRRTLDSALSADDPAVVRKALRALIDLAAGLGKPAEGARYSALLEKLDEAEGKSIVPAN